MNELCVVYSNSNVKLIAIFLFVVVISCSIPISAETNTTSETTDTGSEWKFDIDVDTVSFSASKYFEVTVTLTAVSFGKDISDFHDIILYAKIEENQTRKAAKFYGSVKFRGTYSSTFYFSMHDINSEIANLYARATFRENKDIAFDPSIDTGWVGPIQLNNADAQSSVVSVPEGLTWMYEKTNSIGTNTTWRMQVGIPEKIYETNELVEIYVKLTALEFGDDITCFTNITMSTGNADYGDSRSSQTVKPILSAGDFQVVKFLIPMLDNNVMVIYSQIKFHAGNITGGIQNVDSSDVNIGHVNNISEIEAEPFAFKISVMTLLFAIPVVVWIRKRQLIA